MKNIVYLVGVILLCSLIVGTTQAAFVHPGCLSTQADLDRMAAKVDANEEPWISGWYRLTGNTGGFLDDAPIAVTTVNVGGGLPENYIRLAMDCAKAYQCALVYNISGSTAYGDKSVEILNAWKNTMTGWAGDTNVSLRAGIYGYQLACAAELMRDYPGWNSSDFAEFQTWILNNFYHICSPNDVDRGFLFHHHGTCDSHYWANWDLASMACVMAVGVLCDRQDIFDEGVDYFYSGVGNGNINNAVHHIFPDGTAQWQETGRDQGHTTMGVPLMGTICEIAWNQGVDLYSYEQNKFLASCEYIAKYNLWNDVSYVTYVNCDYIIQTNIGSSGRGSVRPGWDMIYNHYVNRLGISTPYSKEFADMIRPDGGGFNYGTTSGGFDQLGFTTLTHSLVPIASGATPSHLRPYVQGRQITLSWRGSAYATSYNVKRSTTSGGPYTALGVVEAKNTYYIDPGLAAGTTYYYVVSANNPGGESANSAQAVAIADGQLYGTVIGTDGSWNSAGLRKECALDGSLRNFFDGPASVSWVGLDLGSGVSAVVTGVRYCPRPGFASRMVGGKFQGSNAADFSSGVTDLFTISSSPAEGVFTSQSISSGSSFRYVRYISPENGWGNVAEVQFLGNISGLSAPAAPSAPTATSSAGVIDLSWTAVTGADSYNVKRATSSGGPYIIVENMTGTSYTDSGLAAGTYYYVVSAVNSAGQSVNSDEVSADILENVALDCTALANDDNGEWSPGEVAASAFDGDIYTKWYTGGNTGSSGWLQADLGAGNEATVVRYDLTSANDVQNRDPKDWELLGSDDGSNWTTLDSQTNEIFAARYQTNQYSISNSTGYRYYRLNILSNYSGSSADGIQLAELALLAAGLGGGDTTPPAAPTGLVATAGDGSISLDWADNAEGDLASYNVYRDTTSGGPYAQIATGVTVSDYVDNTVSNGTTYYYVVTAVDTSSNESDNSNEDSATPTAANGAPTFNTDPINELNATEDAVYSSTLADDASDPESDPLTFSKVSGPAWLSVAVNGALSGTPSNSDVGANSWTVQVDDGNGGTDTATLNITVDTACSPTPITPYLRIDDGAWQQASDATLTEGQTIMYGPQPISGGSWSWSGPNSYSASTREITLSNVTTADAGAYVATYTNDCGSQSQQTFNLTVNAGGGPVVVFSDSFENGEWNGLWTEDSQNDWFASTQRSVDGSHSAEVDGIANDAALTSVSIDLQGHSNATVTFSWLIESGLDNGEYLAFDVSTNGGSNWTQMAILQGNVAQENTWHNESVDVTGIGSGSLVIRFRGNMDRSNEDADVDMVEVTTW